MVGRRRCGCPNLSMDGTHTGEPVMAAAQGPGSFRVRGYLSNTDLFGDHAACLRVARRATCRVAEVTPSRFT